MPFPTFTFRPQGTRWIGCEFEISFDCEDEPKLCSEPKIRITGLQSVGFIISHEYEIVGPNIIDIEEESAGPVPDCANPKRYRFTLSYRLHDKIGFGINLGPGTGTFGHRFRSIAGAEHFETATICCDEKPKGVARQSGRPLPVWVNGGQPEVGILALIVALFALAWTYHALDNDTERAIYLAVLGVLVTASAAHALSRRMTLNEWRRRNKKAWSERL